MQIVHKVMKALQKNFSIGTLFVTYRGTDLGIRTQRGIKNAFFKGFQMKNICQLALVLAVAFQITACGKNNNNQNGNTTALAPTSFQSCEPGVAQTTYGQAGYGYGYTPQQAGPFGAGGRGGYGGGYGGQPQMYPYSWGGNTNVAQAGFCGCSYGEVPACSPGQGLYCVPSQGISNYAQYNYGGGGYSFGGFGQYSGNSCSMGVGQICQVGVIGSCGQYGQCVQTPSGYGICAN